MTPKYARAIFLSCFIVAGAWAGGIVSYLVIDGDRPHTTEIVSKTGGDFMARPKLFGQTEQKEKATTPYDEATAPEFEFPEANGPGTVAPVVTPEVTPEVAAPPAEGGETLTIPDQYTDVFGAVKRLFNGEGDFQDILKIGIFALSIYGGAQLGGSDVLFKFVLGLFSKKGSFSDILEDRLKTDTKKRDARRGLLRRRQSER
jgi:hypothetical protein